MYGLPAAAAIGRAIDTGRGFSGIAISPQQNFVIVSTADTGEVLLAQEMITGGFALTPIKGSSSNPEMLAMSPRGTAAALWFPALGKLQVVSGLPNAPTVRTIDASFLNESPLAVAVSDDGQWAAGLWSLSVYAFGPGAQVIPLQTDPGVVALAFFHNRHDLALATTARATAIADIGGSAQPSVLYDYSAQSISPRGIAVSFDNQRIIVSSVSGKIVNIGNGAADVVDCGCSPDGLYGLGGSIFRLNGTRTGRNESHSELKLFDATAGTVLIVPPALSETGGRQ
jgi:DNA-binding beta-propeller fold protein YncE